ncbi:hypothetical protein J437_LFUL001647 [Ladona fulva]|uniref:Uncharacterized protein n=1 Tax=Ladona fulva TaxID=123851 RepID=A0A8K0JX58_LADFU|nr:hypothetical protein J437_LFUL001647 [Ladona fulva]
MLFLVNFFCYRSAAGHLSRGYEIWLAMSFPTKDERKKCWDARDRYWECLDGTAEEKEKCLELRKTYEKSCPSQWVKFLYSYSNYVVTEIVMTGYLIIFVGSMGAVVYLRLGGMFMYS